MGFSALLGERQRYGIIPEPEKKHVIFRRMSLLSICMLIELFL